MRASFSKYPADTRLYIVGALAMVLGIVIKHGLITFLLSGLIFTSAFGYIGASIIYYSFTTPVGDNDPHKQLKSALETELLEKENNKLLKDQGSVKDELAGWFTIRTTFDETREADPLFETAKDKTAKQEPLPVASTDSIDSKKAATGKVSLAERALGTYRHLSKTAAASAPPPNYYLVRLKGTVLFVYRAAEGFKAGSTVPEKDDPTFECLGAVTVDQHLVSIEDKHGPYKGIEGRYFNKRNAIVLRPIKSKDGKKRGLPVISKAMSSDELTSEEPKVIYMFCKNNSLTEDMYFALLRNSAKPPSFDKVFSRPHLNWLIDEVGTMTDPSGLGWFNAFAGRIFLGVNQTALVEHFIIDKINKKLALAKHPLITSIKATKANVGHIPPLFSNAMLKRTELYGEISFQAHMNYRQAPALPGSGIHITIEADVGIKILLTVHIKSLTGDVEVKIKQAPTNRFWWGFIQMPEMTMEIMPVVGTRLISMAVVTNFIEKKLREGMAESIVLPNMDDIPFFSTTGMHTRGGIFDEAETFLGPDDDDESDEDELPASQSQTTLESASEDVLETHAVTRSETTPALGRMRKISTKLPSAVASRSSVVSTKSTASESGGQSPLSRTSGDFNTSLASLEFNGKTDTKTSSEFQRNTSSSETDDPGSPKATASLLVDALRSRDKTAIKSQANVAKDSLRKWGVNFVNKRRAKGPEDEDKQHGDKDNASSGTSTPSASNTPAPSAPAPSAYYVPSPEAAVAPVQPVPVSRNGPHLSLQERLAAAASKPAHQRVTSNPVDNITPVPAPTRAPTQRYDEPTVMQPAARTMIVPHVPKRPGVPTAISSSSNITAAAGPVPGPVIVSSLNAATAVPCASPAPPRISRGDSDPLPDTIVDLGSDDDASTPMAEPRDNLIRPVPRKASVGALEK